MSDQTIPDLVERRRKYIERQREMRPDNVNVPLLSDIDFLQYQFLLYGIALVAMMLLRPEGLFPSQRRRRELHTEEDVAFGESGDPMGAAPE